MKQEKKYLPDFYGMSVLARKELLSYFISPAFYGAAVFFLVFCSVRLFYFQQFFAMNNASLRPFFSTFPTVFIIVIPVLTMKIWAEERKTGSIEMLLTMPLSEWSLVLGKFAAAYTAFIMILVMTIPLPVSLFPLGEFDYGVIFSEYFGALLMGASAVSLGLLLSSLSKSQAGSFLGSMGVMLLVMMGSQFALTANLPYRIIRMINFFSLSFHFDSFTIGVIDSRNVVFFTVSTAVFLFITTRIILFRKWR